MEFKVGDRVKVREKIIPKFWTDSWVEEMDEAIGKEGVILREQVGGWQITFDGLKEDDDYGIFNYPEESLEKI